MADEQGPAEFHSYHLHYVGSSLYNPERFAQEAKRLGVNRSLPAAFLKGMAYGQIVLVATWRGKKDVQGKVLDKKDKSGTATAFGYFPIVGLNFQASQETREELLSRLTILETTEDEPMEVERECGSYVIGATHIVKESLAEIVKLGEEIASHRAEFIKWFISGPFFPLEPRVTLDPAKFTRTVLSVETTADLTTGLDPDPKGNKVSFIMDYALRRYVKKADRERLGKIAGDVTP